MRISSKDSTGLEILTDHCSKYRKRKPEKGSSEKTIKSQHHKTTRGLSPRKSAQISVPSKPRNPSDNAPSLGPLESP